MRAGLFNQITGYSLPEAALTAEIARRLGRRRITVDLT
jgi:hypothetical protein